MSTVEPRCVRCLIVVLPDLPPPPCPQKKEDLPLSPFHTPKQKRHRCRNPSKIDVNTLTGDERVPVVNRRSGRKVSARPNTAPCRRASTLPELWFQGSPHPEMYLNKDMDLIYL